MRHDSGNGDEEKAGAPPPLQVIQGGAKRLRRQQTRPVVPRGWLYLTLVAAGAVALMTLGLALNTCSRSSEASTPVVARAFAALWVLVFVGACVMVARIVKDLRGGHRVGGRALGNNDAEE